MDGFFLFIGAAFGYYSAGFMIGVLAPFSAIAIAAAVSAFSDTGPASEDDATTSNNFPDAKKKLRIAATIAMVAFLGSLAYFVFEVFDWVSAKDGEFSIFGKTFHTSKDYQNLLAGVWKQEGSLKFNFNSLFEQVAFGMFPWVCLAPIAAFRMAQGGGPGTNPLGARMLFAWSAITWVLCSIALRKIGPVQYAAVPALAVAMGIWIDELWTARRESIKTGEQSAIRLSPPLIALFVFFAAIVISKDIK